TTKRGFLYNNIFMIPLQIMKHCFLPCAHFLRLIMRANYGFFLAARGMTIAPTIALPPAAEAISMYKNS
ncbi:hypothetical protein Q6247_25845, partial [Klebsiella pneumoniae]